MRCASTAVILILFASIAGGSVVRTRQKGAAEGVRFETTLYQPKDATGEYIESRGVLSFTPEGGKSVAGQWDLGYGFLAIGDQDWFQVSFAEGKRDVIKDLGSMEWSEHYEVPVLDPLPKLAKGEQRNILVDASANTHEAWAATTRTFAKVSVGHIYALHVKDEHSDFTHCSGWRSTNREITARFRGR
jgi:hypothetical protein